MGQLSYNLAPQNGRVGAIAESSEGIHAVAKIANVAIPFGCLAVKDADDKLAKLPTSSAEVLSVKGSGGVAVATHAIVSDSNSDVPTFPIGKEFAALRQGPIFVLVEEDVNDGDQAFVRFADGNGGNVQKGAFRKSVDQVAMADTAVALPGAYYKGSAAAGSLAIVVLNLGGV